MPRPPLSPYRLLLKNLELILENLPGELVFETAVFATLVAYLKSDELTSLPVDILPSDVIVTACRMRISERFSTRQAIVDADAVVARTLRAAANLYSHLADHEREIRG